MRAAKFIRNIAISFGLLFMVLVGGGMIYTWYMGENGPQLASAGAPAPVAIDKAPIRKPFQPSANSPESAAVQSLTSPITPGSDAYISVHTNPLSVCTIKVEYNKVASTDPGLIAKTADDYGSVSWTWTVGSSVPLGKWPVTVTCIWNKKDAVVIGDLIVATQTN